MSQKDPSTGENLKIRAQHTIEDCVWCQRFGGGCLGGGVQFDENQFR